MKTRNFTVKSFKLLVCAWWLLLATGCGQPTPENAAKFQSGVYERILSRGTIRCGYIPYPPGSFKDPNTGRLYGVFVETLEEAARLLNLKVDWVEEVGWATMIEGLQAHRYDLIGTPVWENAARGRLANFSIPLYYSGIGVFVRADDNRFLAPDGRLLLEAINAKTVRLSTSDGDIAQAIAQHDFPQAREVAVSQMADRAQLLLNVALGKADVAFNEPQTAYEFLKSHPGTLKNIAQQAPIRIFPNVMMLNKGEEKFRSMLNAALQEVINNGTVDRLLDKYEPFRGATYRLATPYRSAAAQ